MVPRERRLLNVGMRVIPNAMPPPRLTSSVELEPAAPALSQEAPEKSAAMLRTGFLIGNGRAIFAGLFVGAGVVCVAGYLFSRHMFVKPESAVGTQFVEVQTKGVSAGREPSATPAPLLVQVSADSLRVTSISLGHPRLTVINGKQVEEGDFLTVRPGPRAVAVSLRVLHIGDGRIELTDGTQTITARLSATGEKPR